MLQMHVRYTRPYLGEKKFSRTEGKYQDAAKYTHFLYLMWKYGVTAAFFELQAIEMSFQDFGVWDFCQYWPRQQIHGRSRANNAKKFCCAFWNHQHLPNYIYFQYLMTKQGVAAAFFELRALEGSLLYRAVSDTQPTSAVHSTYAMKKPELFCATLSEMTPQCLHKISIATTSDDR